jgi:large subunit ribosomal protein L25
MVKHSLKVEERKIVGKKVKNIRKQGLLPGNIYGKKIKSSSVSVRLEDFLKVYKEVGETSILNLEIMNAKEKSQPRTVLISNVQIDPVSDLPIHVDFHQVDLKEKVVAKVSIEIEGESPAEKQGIGTVVKYINEIEVEALPTDLPEKFVLDISSLTEVDQAIYLKDLKIDKDKVEVKADLEAIVAKVEPPQKEKVVTPTPTAEEVPAEGEQAAEVAPKEGEEPQALTEKPLEEKKEK